MKKITINPVGVLFSILTVLCFGITQPVYALPDAGTIIGNQASATFSDSEGNQYSATSNLVETIVQPVYRLTLASDRTLYGTAGSTVYFSHLLTNTGNSDETFNLTSANSGGDSYNFSSLGIYLDEDGDGSPDSTTAVSSVTLAIGEQVNVVLSGVIPGLSSANDTSVATLTATSDSDNTQTATVTDTAVVSTGAVVTVVQSMSATSGFADANSGSATDYTVTFSYQNTGNTAATNLTITDVLPRAFHYVDDSGRASLTGSTTLTDDNSAEGSAANGATLTYEYSSVNHTVTFTLNTIAAGESGFVRFDINLLTTDVDGTAVTSGAIANVANFDYSGLASEASNTVNFNVFESGAVALASSGLDTVTVASATQGATITFSHTLSNSGNVSDTYNLSLSGDTYPAGTAFRVLRSDGVTPVVDTNNDGVVDAGLIEPGSSATVILSVSLPPDSDGGPYQVTLTATSSLDTSVSDGVINALTQLNALTVDLTANNTVAGGGDGIGYPGSSGEVTAVGTVTVAPDATGTIALFANNLSSSQDNYDLSVTNLPSGWGVTFYIDSNGDGDVDSGEPEVVNTGGIDGSGTLAILAQVTIPSGTVPVDQALLFRFQSPNSSAVDYLKYQLTVSSVYRLDVALNNSGQAAPGTSVVFQHRIRNSGNVASGDITLSLTHSATPSWNGTLYLDDGATAGELDNSDSEYDASSAPTLAVGAEMVVFARFIVPLGATPGAQNSVTFTSSISTPGGNVTDSATDTITVISTEIMLTKQQALDAACDGTADASFSIASITSGAVPGSCIIY